MHRTLRRPGAIALLAALVAVPTGLPAAAQSGSASQITQRHSILTELGSTGEVSSSRVFTQLTVSGDGDTTVTLPQQSTRGLRSLDGFRGPEVAGDDVVWNVSATREGTRGRTVAENTADLPVDVQVTYSLDGAEVEPDDLVGRSGRLSVTYTVTNLTAEPVEIRPTDARGEAVTESADIAVPMVGSVALTLPPNFTSVDARGSNVAGDGRGNTVVNASLLLFAPLGDEVQEVTINANVTDAVVPGARIQVLPVDEASFGSLRSTSLAYRDAVDGTQTLGYGAQIIDTNVLKLADGAAQLLDGLTQLSDGAGELSDGLANTAAPGAQQLADGTGTARAGAGQLSTGLGELSLGANRLRGGAGDLADGAGKLDAGAGTLASGASRLAAGSGDLRAGVIELRDGILGSGGLFTRVLGGIEQIRDGAVPILQLRADEDDDLTLLDGLTALAGTPRAGATAPTGLLLAAEGTAGLAQIAMGTYESYQDSRGNLAAAVVGTSVTGQTPACVATETCAIGDLLAFVDADPAVVGQSQQLLTAARAGLATVNTGLANSLADLGADPGAPTPANCNAAIQAAQGGDPTGLQALLAAACISNSLSTGINGDGTADNPGASAAAITLRDGAEELGLGLDAGLDDFADQVRAGRSQLQAAFGAEGTDETLLDGVAQVAGGAGELAAGAGELRSTGTRPLAAGASQLSEGSGDLAAGAGTAASGGRDLASGLGQLDDGAVALASGLGDAADGSTQLAEGLTAAEDGGTQVAEGSVALSEQGMSALIDGISDAKLGASRNLETIKAVSERGRRFEGPYGTAARADSSTVWQFEVAGVGDVDGSPSTGMVALLALLALGIAGGVGTVLRRRIV